MPRIEEIFAFVADDSGEGDEGIIGFAVDGQWIPLVVANKDLVEEMRPVAEMVKNTSGKNVKLIHFSNREELEDI